VAFSSHLHHSSLFQVCPSKRFLHGKVELQKKEPSRHGGSHCDISYLGGGDKKDSGLSPAQAKNKTKQQKTPYLKNSLKQKKD
jgi:hypothetical protein